MLNIFELVRDVLDEVYAEIPGTEDEKDAKIKELLVSMGETYRSVWSHGGPSFTDPLIRFAYVFKYVTCHANLVKTCIEKSEDLVTLLQQPELIVTALGGGPGSDTLGVIKYLQANKLKPKVQFHLCDRESLWSETWSDLGMKLSSDLPIHTTYAAHDALVRKTWENSRKFLQAHFFLLIFFISELYKHRENAEAYFSHVFQNAKSGAHFLFIDNNHSYFYNWFDEMASRAGLEQLECSGEKVNMPGDEQKNVLEEYHKKFGPVRLDANIAWRILRKP